MRSKAIGRPSHKRVPHKKCSSRRCSQRCRQLRCPIMYGKFGQRSNSMRMPSSTCLQSLANPPTCLLYSASPLSSTCLASPASPHLSTCLPSPPSPPSPTKSHCPTYERVSLFVQQCRHWRSFARLARSLRLCFATGAWEVLQENSTPLLFLKVQRYKVSATIKDAETYKHIHVKVGVFAQICVAPFAAWRPRSRP